jgi:hypothetical protein
VTLGAPDRWDYVTFDPNPHRAFSDAQRGYFFAAP